MSKIAIVIGDLGTPGGAERVAYDLGNEFVERGHELTLVTFEARNKSAYLPSPGQHIHVSLPSRSGGPITQALLLLRRSWRFRRLFRQYQFDYIFAFMDNANVACALADRNAVLSVHLNPTYSWSERQLTVIRPLYHRVRRVIAVSSQMQQALEQQLGLKNVQTVINPVDTRLLQGMAEDGIKEQGEFIVAVGRLTEQKRFDRLIRAYANSTIREKCRLLILGDGELKAYLQQLTHSLGLGERVGLLGLEKNPYRYMARAEFLVMSSDAEGYPLVLIEALSLGCPVISTNCPTGPAEIIRHEHNGLLTPAGNEEALSAAIDRLYHDHALRARLARQAPETVADNDVRRVADRWLTG